MTHFRHLQAQGRFSEEDLLSRLPNARSEARSKARGVLWLSWLIRQLSEEVSLDPETGCYLTFAAGPVHPPLQTALTAAASEERLAILEKSLPPKDYFIANPAMKAAQIAIEFQLHGPWMCFPSPQTGLQQCFRYAELDLRSGQVPAALVGGFFSPGDDSQSECAFVQYVRGAGELLPCPPDQGQYGPFTALLESLSR